MAQLLWVGTILAALAGTLGLLRLAQRHYQWHAELTRKAAHVAMGLSTLAFPWIFADRWPVVLLAVLAVGLLAAVRTVPFLRGSLGQTLGAVKRSSIGELCFPLSVALVFCLAHGDPKAPPGLPVFYLVPVLVLTLADALGALIGVSYGRARYRTDDGVKSAEGSVAFIFVAFLCCHALLLLGTPLGRAETLLISLHLAMLVAILEAISWNGLDNLFVPVGAYVMLRMFVGMEVWDLFVRFVAIVVLLLALQLWRRRTYLQGSALLGVALALYAVWFLGGSLWIWPALLLWLGYTWLCPRPELRQAQQHSAKGLVAVVFAPILWLLLRGLAGLDTFLPYVLSLVAALSQMTFAHFLSLPPTSSRLRRALASGWAGFGVIGLPYLAGWVLCPRWPDGTGLAVISLADIPPMLGPEFQLRVLALALASFGAVAAFWLWQVRPHGCVMDNSRWARQALIPLALSLLGLALAA